MHESIIVARALSGALLCLSGAAFSAEPLRPEPVAEPLPSAVFATGAVPIPAPADAHSSASANGGAGTSTTSADGVASASASTLEQARGGADVISNEARLSGVVSNNSATQVTTGANIIQSNSFANASGIPVVIQNSGANVLIQNATVINLQLK
jgi:hypothetical protein